MANIAAQFDVLIVRDRIATKPVRWYRGLQFLVLFFLFGLFASGVAAATGANVQNAPLPSVGPGSSFAIADFDGDQRPDFASIEGGGIGSAFTRYSIRFQLSMCGRRAIQLIAPSGGLQLEARDVNGDQAVDLVVTTAWFKQPVAVLLNDGHGGFSRAEPSQFPGAFAHSDRNWNPSTNQAAGAIGIPPPSRSGICCDATNLPDVRGPTDAVRAANSGFPPNSYLIGHAGRAPPFEIPQL